MNILCEPRGKVLTSAKQSDNGYSFTHSLETLLRTHQNHFKIIILPFCLYSSLYLNMQCLVVKWYLPRLVGKTWVKDYLQINLCDLICVQYMMAGIYCTSTIKTIPAKMTGCQSQTNTLEWLQMIYDCVRKKTTLFPPSQIHYFKTNKTWLECQWLTVNIEGSQYFVVCVVKISILFIQGKKRL